MGVSGQVLDDVFGATLVSPAAVAQTDEIQVYDAEIAEPGVFNLMIHSNFTPIGRKVSDFPAAINPNQSENGRGRIYLRRHSVV